MTCPAYICMNVTMGTNESTVYWMVSAFDIVDGDVNTTCWITVDNGMVDVTSGDIFQVVETLVTCEASDGAGNTAMCDFNITVKGNP